MKDIIDKTLDKLPLRIERFFGFIWVISWLIGIWIYHVQFFLTGLFCLFLALLLLGHLDGNNEKKTVKIPVSFSIDVVNKTLTVQKIYDGKFKWDDNEVCSGNAHLPSGMMKKGDMMTNCTGNIALRHIPTNTLIGAYDFE